MIDVRQAPAELRAAVLAMKAADRDLTSEINKATRATMNPVWRALVDANATFALDAVIAKGARIKAGNPPAGVAATSRRRLSGGLDPSTQWHAIEFGADRTKTTTYTRRSPRGTEHTVTRHTARQLPVRRRAGRVAYQAMADISPRLASLWVQLIVRTYYDAAERK